MNSELEIELKINGNKEDSWKLAMLASSLIRAGIGGATALDEAETLWVCAHARLSSRALFHAIDEKHFPACSLDELGRFLDVKDRRTLKALVQDALTPAEAGALWERALKGGAVFTSELRRKIEQLQRERRKAASQARTAARAEKRRAKATKSSKANDKKGAGKKKA